MTSRSIVLGTAALLLMSGATPLQIGFSPTAAFAQEITLEAAMAGNPAELNPQQLRERMQVLRDAMEDGTLRGQDRKAAQQKFKAYREALRGIRGERQEARQDNGQAEQPREGERTQRQRQPDSGAQQQQAQQEEAERQTQREVQQQRKEERQAEREAQREAEQQRKEERQAEREAQREDEQQRKEQQQAEREAQREAEQQRKEERQAEREAQREAEQQRKEQQQAEREAQRQAEQRQAEQRQAEQRQAEQREAEQQRQEERQAEREAQRQAEQRQAEQREAEQQGDTQERAQDDGSQLTPEMLEALRDTRPASELDQAELQRRIQALRAARQSGALTRDQRGQVHARIQADREVALARRAERTQEPTTEQPQEPEQRARDEDVPQEEVEQRAREIIADNRPASDLDSNVLRERLANNRELLGTDQLSRDEQQQLREQLREDREELRARVAARQQEQEEAEEDAQEPTRTGSRDPATDDDDRSREPRDRGERTENRMDDGDVTRIIEERMPSNQLTERELEERVRLLSRALNRGNITVRQGEVARLLIDRDREELRNRLYAERDRRRDRRRSGTYDDYFVEFEVGYRPPPVIYAAEAMPRDIQRQLVAPPTYQTQRTYTPREIATNHDVRESMPGIEIDTLNFDFGSAEVRPEEIEKLDEIGMVIENIVAERPDEVFLIEGHTDAVGSDAANDALSQRRAQAVVEALLDYFIIAPENLETVGLGERYLRINTAGPEEENRRVTVRRITPLLAGRG